MDPTLNSEDRAQRRCRMLNKQRLLQIWSTISDQKSDAPWIRLDARVIDGTSTEALRTDLSSGRCPCQNDGEHSRAESDDGALSQTDRRTSDELNDRLSWTDDFSNHGLVRQRIYKIHDHMHQIDKDLTCGSTDARYKREEYRMSQMATTRRDRTTYLDWDGHQ